MGYCKRMAITEKWIGFSKGTRRGYSQPKRSNDTNRVELSKNQTQSGHYKNEAKEQSSS